MTERYDYKDIWIENGPVAWQQDYDDTLNYEALGINRSDYSDYQPTRLQFSIGSPLLPVKEVKVGIKYANRLTRTQVKHAIVCRYNPKEADWEIVPHTLDQEKKEMSFRFDTGGRVCIFINHYWYSEMTQRLADEYPNWTEIRNREGSTGQLFLNYFGMELETVTDYLEWIQEQKHIGTADTSALDWVKMYVLPDVKMSDDLKFMNSTREVPLIESLKEFFYNDQNKGGIVDYQEMRMYTTRNYGDLTLTVKRNEVATEHSLTPMDYHIWNTFDEFGMLLGVERINLETNAELKERILDVFRYPAGTHDEGLTNGIARELRLVKRLTWEDDSKDLYLKNTSGKSIDLRTIRVDDKPVHFMQVKQDTDGGIRIHALNEGKQHTVSFIFGIEKYQLYDKSNESLHKMLYKEDGQATPTLINWVEYINTVAPVMWDRFNWDEGFWDTITKELTGLGYIPNIWDSNIDVWKGYTFESDR